ncbi:MAG: hypothetical protein K2N94_07820 [Lachnospiraceae bacterium]|nr:hypothetical protein [Lachnospiraceae bacterium]
MKDGFPEIVIKEKGSTTEILINGKPVEGVNRYSVEHEGGEAPILRLDFPAVHMTLDGKLIPELPEIFKGFYVRRIENE